ncbi:MAG: hypothetical protein KDD84_24325, partial [Caldilineaceae bacterium]|nr:hypothetical protein [Caldilineaceae bacterium]
RNWDLYDTRHVVYRPKRISPQALEAGYWRAYEDFYRWGSILRGASSKPSLAGKLRHVGYAGGWKKLEPLWDWVIRARRVNQLLPMLEALLAEFGGRASGEATTTALVDRSAVGDYAERPVR